MIFPTDASADDVHQLSPLVRWQRAFQALGKIVANPEATDQVLVFSTYANAGSMHRRLHRFFEDPDGMKLELVHAPGWI